MRKFVFGALAFSQLAFGLEAPRFVSLVKDRESYSTGQKAVLTAHVNVLPSNPNDEIYLEATLSETPLALTQLTKKKYAAVSPAFDTPTTALWHVDVYLRDSRQAKQLNALIAFNQQEIFNLERQLEAETDPEVRQMLQDQIARDQANVASAQAQLLQIRRLVETDELELEVTGTTFSAPVSAQSVNPVLSIQADRPLPQYAVGETATFSMHVNTDFQGPDGIQENVVRAEIVSRGALPVLALGSRDFSSTTPQFANGDVGYHDFHAKLLVRSKSQSDALRSSITEAGSRRAKYIQLRNGTTDPMWKAYYQKKIDDLTTIIDEFYRQLEESLTQVAENTFTYRVYGAPTVNAGGDQAVTLPNGVNLNGSVTTDPPRSVTVSWSKVSGPGTVVFSSPTAVQSSAMFGQAGTYVLQLSATDSDGHTGTDSATITVNGAIQVNAGSEQTVTLPSTASLQGSVTTSPSRPLSYAWTKTSGPGTVTFGNAQDLSTTAAFSDAGDYVLTLTVTDSSGGLGSSSVTVHVNGVFNVNAGDDQTITMPNSANLSASISTQPPRPYTVAWTKTSGPGNVVFGNSSAEQTTATFDQAGDYVLTITATDNTSGVASDSVSVSVNGPITVTASGNSEVTMPNHANLNGSASSTPSRPFTYNWTSNGPAAVTFGSQTSPSTSVSFSQPGTYILHLHAYDSSGGEGIADVTVNVNGPLVVDAGPDQEITLPSVADLNGSVTTTPERPITVMWSQNSGPGTVSFGDTGQAQTTASFSQAGTYVLMMSVTDAGGGNVADTVTITVAPQPLNMSVSAGNNDVTCGMVNGAAKCWGDNSGGAIGDGTRTNRLVATQVFGLTSGVTDVDTGGFFACAVVSGGAKCWGSGASGELGNGTNSYSDTPSNVIDGSSNPITGVTKMASGSDHTCAIVNGGVKCWGYGAMGQIGSGGGSTNVATNVIDEQGQQLTNVTMISAGVSHTCALANGVLKCWGSNSHGQIGDGTTGNKGVATTVPGISGTVTRLSAGGRSTCAVVDGALKCWGKNDFGKLGTGDTADRTSPTDVPSMASGVLDIGVGALHTCVVVTGGAAKCWGRNNTGQLGNGSTTDSLQPIDTNGLSSNVVSISAGNLHTCAIVSSGSGKCWGAGGYGQLGYGVQGPQHSPIDVQNFSSGSFMYKPKLRKTPAPKLSLLSVVKRA